MAGPPSLSPFNAFHFNKLLKRGDVVFALGLLTILVLMILPMPKWLLDVGLAISITFSLLILMTSLFIEKPLDFNSFPTILLVSTMLRLSLNIASTRLILSKGHEGPGAAGDVIKTFGNFLMGDNFLIGVIVFAILLIVNFVVITKGSGRIAEVSARFSLDSLPGKQMAIDADLSAGLIDEQQAKDRRKNLENESNFFGAMDGAAKFVRGDAIAGLLITGINIIAGILIGVNTGLSFDQAAHAYTLLTVGDGLVSQIPALIVSTAAGMLVSKGGTEGSSEKALFKQLSAHPIALGLVSFSTIVIGFIPGTPKFAFFCIAALTGGAAWYLTLKPRDQEESPEEGKEQNNADAIENPDSLESAIQIDQIRLELGYGLLKMVNDKNTKSLTEQIKTLRHQLAAEIGFILPSVRIQDNLQIGATEYSIKIKEVEAGKGSLRPNQLLAMNPSGDPIELVGENTHDPAFGIPAMWFSIDQRATAEKKGYTIVPVETVLITHFSEIVKDNLPELLTYAETRKILDHLPPDHDKLLKEIVPSQVSYGTIQRVLHNLLRERVSIRDLSSILEAIAEVCSSTTNVRAISEHVRSRLARQICSGYADANNILAVVHLSSEWEKIFLESLYGEGENKQLTISPSQLQDFITKTKNILDELGSKGEQAILLTSSPIRFHVRNLIERFHPLTPVLAQTEIHPKVRIKTIGHVD